MSGIFDIAPTNSPLNVSGNASPSTDFSRRYLTSGSQNLSLGGWDVRGPSGGGIYLGDSAISAASPWADALIFAAVAGIAYIIWSAK